MPRHRLGAEDRAKRRGDRRLLALEALAAAQVRARGVTPNGLAHVWVVHPSSAYRVLERLRKAGSVNRTGRGLGAIYTITEVGANRMSWLKAKFLADQEPAPKRPTRR